MNKYPQDLYKSLEEYCEQGRPVFPVSFNKIPLIKGWRNKASSDLSVVKKWWTQFPTANIGIATGRKAGFWVLDIDIKNGVNGLESLASEYADFNPEDFIAHVRSPSGGLHCYFEWSDNLPVTVASNVIRGNDIRGEGGYIMAPPSARYTNGKISRYEQLVDEIVLKPAPTWAINIAQRTLNNTTRSASKTRNSFDVSTVMKGVSQGGRDDSLYRYACHLKGCDVPYELAVGFIKEAASRCCPPFPEQVAVEKVSRAYLSQSIR